MFWTIVRREFLDHLVSFRFTAVFLLTVFLTVVSVMVFSVDFEQRKKAFQREPAGLIDASGKTSLMMLPCNGWGVQRAPSQLAFLSGGTEQELPNRVSMALHCIQSIDRAPEMGEIAGTGLHADWAAAVSLLLSFAAGLLTYKSISGESRDGTLTLLLSNPVSKATVLSAKYAAALLALTVSFTIAVVAGLLVLRVMGIVDLSGDDLIRIGLFGVVGLMFLSVFVLVGLLCSVLTRTPVIAAVAFLLSWTVLVVVVPNVGGMIAGLAGRVQSPLQYKEMSDAIPSQYPVRPGMEAGEFASIQIQREKAWENLLIDYVNALLHQVELGKTITRLSPSGAYVGAVEGIAGLGTSRFRRFIDNAVRYREGLFRAALEADRGDSKSEHRYVPWRCGSTNFSRETVDLGSAKEFHDPPPSSLEGLATAGWDILLLAMYNLILFSLAFWRFASRDVAPTPGV
jgi:ABC-type transport system involved in multi-copper enzyme maturation permease subunit